MTALQKRDWVPAHCEETVQLYAGQTATQNASEIAGRIRELARVNRVIHEKECFNLNPATNVMNPRAEVMLASGIGSRPSLGYPGDKYEMGLEAIEEIEVIAAELCAEVFDAKFAEIRVGSGALANLYAFMAICKPGDTIIVPPASIGGHVTHNVAGCAGLYGLDIHEAPVNADGYTIDVNALRALAKCIRPKLISVGGSLNLFPHPVGEIRKVADEVGARILFDAAHQCGMIAGKVWSNPIHDGADLMTMSTYKSLGGPAGGLIVTNDAGLAQKLDAIAFPGMTANFDAAKSAALALTMLDWREYGARYAQKMVQTAQVFARTLDECDVPVFARAQGFTRSHQFAVEAATFGGGQAASKMLRKAGYLACGIGLPIADVPGDMNGLRIGTPELVRWGVTEDDIPEIATLVANALHGKPLQNIALRTAELRRRFDEIHYICAD
ncbi:serine hydroxymethyltransferase [Thalassospira alkalitolerans]|uniref:serine hydroxymethyltransferase n=1 Tax=Thalassospira alkalitolerans TaxID=1293890 RepID=UPI003AA89677